MKPTFSQQSLILEYLDAAGVTGVSIVAGVDGCRLLYGRNKVALAGLVSTHWVEAAKAHVVVKTARKLAGTNPNRQMLEAGLYRAAITHGATLTENGLVMMRAGAAAKTLAERLELMNDNGALTEFNQQYKRNRAAATMRGEGYMQYPAAMRRLRRAIIKTLTRPGPHGSLFDEVFGVNLTK